jgi:hypothetical protein
MIVVFAVVCSNYEPREVAELYVWREEAEKHVDALNETSDLTWHVLEWAPRRNYIPGEEQ